MRGKELTVVYTIDPAVVEDSINTMGQLLAKDDKYKVVGFDIQYTGGRPGVDQAVAVAQLCMGHHVLIYHYCVATSACERFTRFVKSSDYKFATVDTVNDVKALQILGLACPKLVNICGHYRVWGSTKKDSLVELTTAIIDPYYENMKEGSKRNPGSWHGAWVRRLDEPHLKFVATNMYTCYEMHRQIVDMRECLLPVDDEGSSHQQSSSGKRHKKK
jgi:hypothetical protein